MIQKPGLQNKVFQSPKQKGFILFVVIGILGVLGLVFFSLSWVTRQQNVQSHKTYYNEIAKTLAESGTHLLSRAIREGIRLPSPEDLARIPQDSNFQDRGFYGFFLQPHSRLNPEDDSLVLSDSEVRNLMEERFIEVEKAFLEPFKGAELNYEIRVSSQPLFENGVLKDEVEKFIELTLRCTCTYLGTNKSFEIIKPLKVYNLLAPVTSKFTFYHKLSIGRFYNKLKTNLLGQPIRDPLGNFVNPYNFPLVLFNGPLKKGGPIKSEGELLEGSGGTDFSSFEVLTSKSRLEDSKENILRRGFLYFGPGGDQENIMNLTPGAYDPKDSLLGGYGEYFVLFNYLINGGPQNYPALLRDVPEFFTFNYQVLNKHPDGDFNTEGHSYLRALHEGYYGPDPANGNHETPAAFINGRDYHSFSSLIHPFGSNENPSRAYTVGNAYRAVAKVTSVGLDRRDDGQDESEQSSCFGYGMDTRDGVLAYLMETTEAGFLNPNPGIDLYVIQRNMSNMNHTHIINQSPVTCDSEPDTLRVGPEFNYNSMFSDFETYDKFMSKVLYIPMNHLLDYPHFTHSFIPPNGHRSFEEFMFEPKDKDALLEIPTLSFEEWPLPPSSLHPKDSFYLQGDPDSFQPEDWIKERDFLYLDREGMEKMGILTKGRSARGEEYVIDGRSHQIHMSGDLLLDRPVVVASDTSLVVDGDCNISSVKSPYYFNIFCNNITLLEPNLEVGSTATWDGFYHARKSLKKANPGRPVGIFGGIAMESLDLKSFFNAPSFVHYRPEFSPTEPNIALFYRMVLDDHTAGDSHQL